MKILSMVRIALLVMMLAGSWQATMGQPSSVALRNAFRSSIASKATQERGIATTFKKHVLALLAASSLMLASPQAIVQAQMEAGQEDPNAAWSIEMEGGIYDSVMYLALSNPDYDHLHHVIYLGEADSGEPLFAGLYLIGHEEDHIRLYDRNSLVTQDFKQMDVEVFPDPLDSFSEVRVFTIKDLNLQGDYEPIIPGPYPVNEIGEKLEMVAYGMNAEDPESLFDLPLMRRSCEVVNPQGWANVGVGLHNCAPMEGANHSFFGAPIFRDGKLVAFNAGKTRSAYSAEGTYTEFLEYLGYQTPAAVRAKDKLPTTWAALKAGL